MRGANLAQATAPLNRVFQDKPGGLVVDYIGIAPQLKEALATYTAANGKGRTTIDSNAAFDLLNTKLREIRALLEPLDWSGYRDPKTALALLPHCLEHILALPEGKKRFGDLVLSITKTFALCGTPGEALALSEEVAFLQGVRALLLKGEQPEGNGSSGRIVDHQLQQLLSEALVSEGVADIFQAAGLRKPDISLFSEEFLADIAKLPQKNLAVELLQRLLRDEVKTRFPTNVVKQKRFSELLQASLAKYANRSVEAAQVIDELIAMAREFRLSTEKAKALGLIPAEEAFYDSLANNASALELMGDEMLMTMARGAGGQAPRQSHHRLAMHAQRMRPPVHHDQSPDQALQISAR